LFAAIVARIQVIRVPPILFGPDSVITYPILTMSEEANTLDQSTTLGSDSVAYASSGDPARQSAATLPSPSLDPAAVGVVEGVKANGAPKTKEKKPVVEYVRPEASSNKASFAPNQALLRILADASQHRRSCRLMISRLSWSECVCKTTRFDNRSVLFLARNLPALGF
jgi:hypothetical protein